MARGVNLTSAEWRDLIFEGKNKEFGAYQLRKKSTKRHLWAILGIIVLLIAVAISVYSYIAYREMKEAEEAAQGADMSEVIIEAEAEVEEEEEEEEVKYEEPEPEDQPVEEDVASQQMTEIAIVEKPDKDKEVKNVTEVQDNQAQIGNIDKEGRIDVSAVQNATKDIIAPPEPPKVEPKPEPRKPEPEKIFEAVEQQAQFPGGHGALNSWLAKNLKYPEVAAANNVEGKVIVQFVVEEDGSISQVTVARGVDKDLDREAVRVVKRMPKWQPGKNNGVAVRSKFTLPVVFKLQH